MAESIIADPSTKFVAATQAEAAAEEAQERRGFREFSWLTDAAVARHGPKMSAAFNIARSVLHGNAAMLEILEDQGMGAADRAFGIGRTGDVMRMLVTFNQLAADRIAEACDEVNKAARESC